MTNDTKAPERIGIIPNGLGEWALATVDEAEQAVHYTRHDHALALAAAAVAHPQDAQAALEARDKRVTEDERKRIKVGLGELLAGQSESLPRALRQKMLALIEGDTDE